MRLAKLCKSFTVQPLGEPLEHAARSRRTRTGAVVALCLFGGALLQYYLYSRGLYTFSADESCRSVIAWRWSMNPHGIRAETWLPVYKILLGFTFIGFPDLFFTPRILNGILGLAVIASTGWLASTLLERRAIALLTMILSTVFAPRVLCSVVPLSEITFVLLLILSLTLFARWLKTGRDLFLMGSGLLITAASGVRYEAWLFGVLIYLVATLNILIRERHMRSSKKFAHGLLGLIIGLMPLLWIWVWYRDKGDALGFLTLSGDRYVEVANPSRDGALLWKHGVLWQFFLQNLKTLNLVGIAGLIIHCLKDKRVAVWCSIPVASLLVMSIISLLGHGMPSHNFWRIAVGWSILLLPFTASFVLQLAALLQQRGAHAGLGLTVAAVLIFSAASVKECVTMSQRSEMDWMDIAVGREIASGLASPGSMTNSRVLMEENGTRYYHVMVASRHPDAFVVESSIEGRLNRGGLATDLLRMEGIRFLVLRSGWLELVRANSAYFKRVIVNDRWIFIELPDP